MFIHINHEEAIQLLMDHNGVSTMDECMSHKKDGITKIMKMILETRVYTDYNKFSNKH